VFENLPQGCIAGVKIMSTATINAVSAKTLINQGFSQVLQSTNPSGVVLNRRGRLARTLVILSLAIVMVATFAFSAGAGSTDSMAATPDSYVTVVVGPGESLWSLAGRMAGDGDARSLIEEIMAVNSLATPDVQAGQTLRIPLHG
jgi:nucleoid-associated protein YgaU